ncbi:hypothetical protein ACH5A2_10925 [Streptomyces collinus]|uniref:hypothetical protein n=1 Tax=Streptomyces collinus TaxID=42684 RepID=UPI0037A96B2F
MNGMQHMRMTGPMWMPTAPPTLQRLLAWQPQPLPVEPAACLLALAAYLLAVRRLRRRGDRRPSTAPCCGPWACSPPRG